MKERTLIPIASQGMTFLVLVSVYVAVLIWLTVRIVNRRERWAKRSLAGMLAAPVIYVGSFGPACWLTSQVYVEGEQVH